MVLSGVNLATKQDSGTSQNSVKSEDNYTVSLLPSHPSREASSNVYSISKKDSAEVLATIRVREFPSSPTQYSLILDPLSGPRREIANIERGEIGGSEEFDLDHLEQYVSIDEYVSELEDEDTPDEDEGIDSYWAEQDEKVYIFDGEIKARKGEIGEHITTQTLGAPMVDPEVFLQKASEEGWSTDEIKDRLNGVPAGAD